MADSSSYTWKSNINADFMSRLQNGNNEWRLSPAIFIRFSGYFIVNQKFVFMHYV